MFGMLGKLLKCILWPIGSLIEWIITGLVKLIGWSIDGFIKIGDKLLAGISDKRIPFPENAPKEEAVRRLDMNIEILLKEIYEPDKKLEELLGCCLIDKDPQMREGLSYDELLYCYQQVERYFQAAGKFGKIYMPMVSAMCDDYANRLKLVYTGKRAKKRWFDDSTTSLKTIKKIWCQTLRDTKPDIKDITKDADALEAVVRGLVKAFGPMLRSTFASCYQLLIILHLNFHSTKIAVYDLE